MKRSSSTDSTRNLGPLIGAIDQGTSSSRFMVFSAHTAELVTYHQIPVLPDSDCTHKGWIQPGSLGHCGNRHNKSKRVCHSLGQEHWETFLPCHTLKLLIGGMIKWLMENVPEVRDAIKEKRVLFGTVDTWLLWNLAERIHVTDVTNASRTSLMNIETLEWDENLCSFFCRGRLAGVPISGCIGDQQAALVGQKCLRPGEMKATYGTGCFILKNIGPKILHSRRGLLTTVAYKAGPDSLPVLPWYQFPFLVFFSPHWRPDARGIIMGLNRFSSKEHIFRATLEAAAYQTRDILEAMYEEFNETDSPSSLLVDGGLTENGSAMQILSDILGIPVLKPSMSETTALGAAIMAGRAEGIEVWDTRLESPSTKITVDHFLPHMSREERHRRYEKWKKHRRKKSQLDITNS
ncbi:glpK [Lepeophtheirus salmonis]|uniref:glycerol kinase n=1 Tax=Lepeophtheirus salmonis TaxID=72036 RepID=A0A7R8CLF3_LEPSM|nr:glpK [Lepeophtheirus salmonis]CAF2811935.1 glpK [Lepeophtheirus salmonis]